MDCFYEEIKIDGCVFYAVYVGGELAEICTKGEEKKCLSKYLSKNISKRVLKEHELTVEKAQAIQKLLKEQLERQEQEKEKFDEILDKLQSVIDYNPGLSM